jgi:hypothetical protein
MSGILYSFTALSPAEHTAASDTGHTAGCVSKIHLGFVAVG